MTDQVHIRAKYIDEKSGQGIVVSCEAGPKPSIYIILVSSIYLGEGFRPVTYRVDNLPPVELSEEPYFAQGTRIIRQPVVPFVKTITAASRLRARLYSYQGHVVDLDLPLAGAAEPIGQVIAACGDHRFDTK